MKKNLLLLGVNGMLGHTLFKYFFNSNKVNTYGLLRNKQKLSNNKFLFTNKNINVIEFDKVEQIIEKLILWDINILINCVGVVKQNRNAFDPLESIKFNALFPHELNFLLNKMNIRLIHISTDCVFSGNKGFYDESDISDTNDLYGRSKFLGELTQSKAITLRTSFIGNELSTKQGLLSWFLNQKGTIRGFSKAIYSGVTTVELAKIIEKYILPNENLKGLYHVSAEPINKFDLLSIINEVYAKDIKILKDETYKINRSLDSTKFREATGFKPSKWYKVIEEMKEFDEVKP